MLLDGIVKWSFGWEVWIECTPYHSTSSKLCGGYECGCHIFSQLCVQVFCNYWGPFTGLKDWPCLVVNVSWYSVLTNIAAQTKTHTHVYISFCILRMHVHSQKGLYDVGWRWIYWWLLFLSLRGDWFLLRIKAACSEDGWLPPVHRAVQVSKASVWAQASDNITEIWLAHRLPSKHWFCAG